MTPKHPRPCSAAAALGVIGEKWSLLVIRELAFGVHRFDAIAANTGAPRDILTNRLRGLEEAKVVERRRYQEHPPRFGYHLTRAGHELRPILLSIAQWGDRWAVDAPSTTFVHECGEDVELVHTCRACGGEITGFDLEAKYLTPDWPAVAAS